MANNYDYYVEAYPLIAESVTAELHKFGAVEFETKHLECRDFTMRYLIPISGDMLNSLRNPDGDDVGFSHMCFFESRNWEPPILMDDNAFRKRDERILEVQRLIEQKKIDALVAKSLLEATGRIRTLAGNVEQVLLRMPKLLPGR